MGGEMKTNKADSVYFAHMKIYANQNKMQQECSTPNSGGKAQIIDIVWKRRMQWIILLSLDWTGELFKYL